MTKIEFGDLYKFFASVGVVLIFLSIILPWLFLQEPSKFISISEINKLPQISAEIYYSQLSIIHWIIQHVFILSTVFFSIGLIILIFGIVLWYRKQRHLDKNQLLKNQKLMNEIEAKEPEQIALEKIDDARGFSGYEEEKIIKPVVRDIFEIERTIINNIKATYGEKYFILEDRTIDYYGYDLILISKTDFLVDIIVEIKYSKKYPNQKQMISYAEQLSKGMEIFKESALRKAHGVILLILNSELVNYEEIQKKQEIFNNEILPVNNKIHVRIVPYEEITKNRLIL